MVEKGNGTGDQRMDNQADDQAEFKVSKWTAYFWFSIIWLAMALDYADRQAVAALMPLIKKEYLLTDAQSGGLMSVLTMSLGVCAFPVAFVMDRWARGKVVAGMVLIWSIATWVTGMAKSYGQMLIARGIVGVGEAGYGPAAGAFLSTWFPKTIRGRMNGLFTTAIVAGNSGGIALVGYLAYHFGWKSVFGALTIPGIILAALFWFMPDYKAAKVNNSDGTAKEQKVNLAGVLKYALSTRSLIGVYLVGSALYCVQMAVVSWAPTYFSRTYGMNVKEAGATVAIMGLFAALGPILCGFLGDYMVKKYQRGRIIANGGGAIAMILTLLVALYSPSFAVTTIFWSVSWALMSGIVTNNAASCMDLSPLNMRASTYSLVAVFNHFIGSSVGPFLAGILSDSMGLKAALTAVSIGSTVVLLIFLGVSYIYFERDLAKMRSIGTYTLQSK